jgi:hypothetical protein
MANIDVNSWQNFCPFYKIDGIEFFDTPEFPVIDGEFNTITIDQRYMGRLDLLSFDFYQNANLWWVVALYNELQFIPSDMKLGMTLKIPTQSVVSNFLDKSNGVNA